MNQNKFKLTYLREFYASHSQILSLYNNVYIELSKGSHTNTPCTHLHISHESSVGTTNRTYTNVSYKSKVSKTSYLNRKLGNAFKGTNGLTLVYNWTRVLLLDLLRQNSRIVLLNQVIGLVGQSPDSPQLVLKAILLQIHEARLGIGGRERLLFQKLKPVVILLVLIEVQALLNVGLIAMVIQVGLALRLRLILVLQFLLLGVIDQVL